MDCRNVGTVRTGGRCKDLAVNGSSSVRGNQ